MKFPKLVPPSVCKTPISVTLYGEGLTDRGESQIAVTADLLCNYQDGGKTLLTDKQKIVQISGSAYFDGDIAPSLAVISGGEAVIFDSRRRIAKGIKARNPDGTVNYTVLELI